MKNKIVSFVLFLVTVLSAFSFTSFTSSAETEGIFDYYDEGDYGYVMIAKCNKPEGKVVIPSEIGGNPVITIHDGAFRNATELTAVVIPETISGIYATSFEGCTNLKDVYYEGSASEWNKIQIGFESEMDGGIRDIPLFNATIHFNGKEEDVPEKKGVFEYVIEDKRAIITKCDKGAKGKIEVPEKIENCPVTSIGNHAFSNCTQIEEVILPDTLEEISTAAFSYCEKLRDINIPQSVTDIKSFAFVDCGLLEYVCLPTLITEIPMNMFKGCGLRSIVIPRSVKKICYRAFAWCENLEYVTLSKGLETVEEGAFSYTAIKELTFPDGFKKTEQMAVTYCENLEAISFPDSTEEIGLKICEGCPKLKSVKYEGSESNWERVNLVQPNNEIEKISIEFSNTKPTIGNEEKGYYYIVENNEAVVTGCNADIADNYADIPQTLGGYPVTKIAPNAFASTKISGAELPSGVREIGANAFAYCWFLGSIDMPQSVKTVGRNAFYGCDEMTDVSYEAYETDWEKIKFADEETKEKFKNLRIAYGSWVEEESDLWGLVFGAAFACAAIVIIIVSTVLVKKKKANKKNIRE